jgi:hypothetical protein
LHRPPLIVASGCDACAELSCADDLTTPLSTFLCL